MAFFSRSETCPILSCAQCIYEFLILVEAEQTCPVMVLSIVATIRCRNYNCNHLATHSTELFRSVHCSVV